MTRKKTAKPKRRAPKECDSVLATIDSAFEAAAVLAFAKQREMRVDVWRKKFCVVVVIDDDGDEVYEERERANLD